MEDIDAIAVTVGPGLIGSLLVGVETAKTLACIFNKPIVPINHLVAHIYANWLSANPNPKAFKSKLPQFPALALVVSGGHTDLVLMKDHGKITWIGGTRDDAAGEAFDKCARLLGLPYPGGPAISSAASTYQSSDVNRHPLTMFPRPIITEKNFDWSFSGLKTAVLRETQKLDSKLNPLVPKLAAEVQEAIVDVLVEKSIRAIKKIKPKSFLLAGGVAANSRLREKFKIGIEGPLRSINPSFKIDFLVPPPALCTDNAAYIAACAFYNYSPAPWKNLEVRPELAIVGQI